MFEKTLLESSLDRVPLLTSGHRIVAMLAGLGGFLIAWKLLPILLFAPNPKTLLWQSQLAGTALAFHALMVCYVHAGAKRLRLTTWGWSAITFLFSFAGFLAFLVYSALKTGDWKRATVPIAYILEAVLLGGLVIVPLIHTQGLGLIELAKICILVGPPPAPPPAGSRTSGAKPRVAPSRGPMQIPPVIPSRIPVIIEEAEPFDNPGPDLGFVPGGIPSGVPGGFPPGILAPSRPAPFLPPTPAQASKLVRIHVGGQVEAARAIFQPAPEYPPLAKMARIQGVVRLEAVISVDGTIQNLKLISGPPLLVRAAIDAVARWRYQPTLLNGEPVEVLTEIDVNFRLAD